MLHASKRLRAGLISLFTTTAVLAVSIAEARPLTRSEIGELFIFGIPEARIDQRVRDHLARTCPGSILLFRRNLQSNLQTIELIQELRAMHRKCSKEPLFVGLDQEGGQVARVPMDPPMPSPWAVGLTKDRKLAEDLGHQIGLTLRKLGFNMNLAPVLDLGHERKKSFIGSRSFGADPKVVGEIGTSFSMGLVRSRVLPVAKHFPGIGSVPNDPHQVMVRRPASVSALWENDLKPFQSFAELFPTGMMPSHLIYPGADLSEGPGTFSRTLLQDWLRERLNYKGVVVSDDLLMKGAQESADVGRNVVSALRAGVDLVMVSWSLKSQARAIQAVQAAVRSGTLTEDFLREKIQRVRKIKQVIGEPNTTTKGASSKLLLMGSHRYTDLTLEVLRKNLKSGMSRVTRSKPQRLFVWPGDVRSRWQLERQLHQPVLNAASEEFKKIRSDDMIVAFVRTRRDARSLAGWSREMKKKTIVVNQIEPGLFDGTFAAELEVYLQHPMLASELGKGLKSTWTPSLVSSRQY